MKSYLGSSAPRGIRNNNPGNLVITSIKWQGKIPVAQNTDKKFEQFRSIEYGIRAMAMDVLNDINKGKNTLNMLITEYAPPAENDTLAYIKAVSQKTGLKHNEVIKPTPETLAAIIGAKIQVENGKDWNKYLSAQDIKNGIALMPNKTLEAIKTVAKTGAVISLPIIFVFLALLIAKK
jgi:hypothetical protein